LNLRSACNSRIGAQHLQSVPNEDRRSLVLVGQLVQNVGVDHALRRRLVQRLSFDIHIRPWTQ